MSFISHHIGHKIFLKPPAKDLSRRNRLHALLMHANTETPYYKGRYSEFLTYARGLNDADFFDAFSRTPITSKQDLRQHNNDFVGSAFEQKKDIFAEAQTNSSALQRFYDIFIRKDFKVPISTGGTSGDPTYRWLDYADSNAMAQSFFESFKRNGWDRGESFVLYYPLRSYFTDSYAAYNDWLHRLFGFTVVPFENITLQSVQELLHTLETRKAKLLVIFPCVLQRVAEIMHRHNIPPFRGLNAINVSGEFFFDCSYSFIRSMFPDSRIEITYGAVEIGEIAHQHENSRFDYKVFEQYAYVEQGEDDSILVTALQQSAFPMIRYKMEDKAYIVTRPNGQQFLMNLEGKNTDFLIGANSEKYYASFFNRFINDLNPICGGQIIHFMMRHDGKGAHLHYVLKQNDTNMQTIIERETMQMMRMIFPQFRTVRVSFPDHFAHDYTRKFKIISSGDGLSEVVGGFHRGQTV